MLSKIVVFLFVITVQLNSFRVEAGTHPPLTAVGVHGMALLWVDGRLFASHMPLHHSIHAQQLLLELEVDDKRYQGLIEVLTQEELVSIMPEVFDLNHLADGQLKSFSADVYLGHFEREGRKYREGIKFSLKNVLLKEHLQESENGFFYVVELDRRKSLLVHRIGKLPSFDQLLLVTNIDSPVSGLIEFPGVISAAFAKSDAMDQFSGFKLERVLYTETQDFEVRH